MFLELLAPRSEVARIPLARRVGRGYFLASAAPIILRRM